MSGGDPRDDDVHAYIDTVKYFIETCFTSYMNKNQCKEALWDHDKITPVTTETIWNHLMAENPEFFRAYYIILALIKQIKLFNLLLEEQLRRTHGMAHMGLARLPPTRAYDGPCLSMEQRAIVMAAARETSQPLNLEAMQQPQVFHNFEPSPQEFDDPQNDQQYSEVEADWPSSDAPQNAFQPNVYVPGRVPSLVDPRNQDVVFAQTFNPSSYGNLEGSLPLTDDASLNGLSSYVCDALNIHDASYEDILSKYFGTSSAETNDGNFFNPQGACCEVCVAHTCGKSSGRVN